jgi:hypothetical protein
MPHVVIFAGLPTIIHDAVKAEAEKKFVPNGRLILKPLTKHVAYSASYANSLIADAHTFAATLSEPEELSIILCYVDTGGRAPQDFVRHFFPYALPVKLNGFQYPKEFSKNELNRQLSEYINYLQKEARRAIDLSLLIKRFTNVHNLTPLILPRRNFDSVRVDEMLEALFWNIGESSNPEELISTAIDQFVGAHPRTKATDDDRHCFSDGRLYFKSPGRSRHGFFRYVAENRHSPLCLLNARSRIGGIYDYKFHYDCTPVAGRLASSYPNCHNVQVTPKPTYVNIAPNDFIR